MIIQRMPKISPSVLAFDIFELENSIKNLVAENVEKLHVDIIDPSFANYIGVDFKLIEKISKIGIKFDVHYMALWNEELIKKILELGVRKIFFHQERINNLDFFNSINAGIAIEIGEKVKIDCDEYIIMHVIPGYCNQKFDETNLELSKQLKKENKIIIADGGVNFETIEQLKHYDELVIGSALTKHSLKEFYEKLK